MGNAKARKQSKLDASGSSDARRTAAIVLDEFFSVESFAIVVSD
jgi:hypothetical protein